MLTEALLLELTPNDFMAPAKYEGVDYDTYGIAISENLQERFNVRGLETWYLKLTVETARTGERVLIASLHEPKEPLKRIGGTIPVRFKRSDK